MDNMGTHVVYKSLLSIGKRNHKREAYRNIGNVGNYGNPGKYKGPQGSLGKTVEELNCHALH
jgi:hypothetical protein